MCLISEWNSSIDTNWSRLSKITIHYLVFKYVIIHRKFYRCYFFYVSVEQVTIIQLEVGREEERAFNNSTWTFWNIITLESSRYWLFLTKTLETPICQNLHKSNKILIMNWRQFRGMLRLTNCIFAYWFETLQSKFLTKKFTNSILEPSAYKLLTTVWNSQTRTRDI